MATPGGLALPHTCCLAPGPNHRPVRITQHQSVRPCSLGRYQNPSGRTNSTLAKYAPGGGIGPKTNLLRSSMHRGPGYQGYPARSRGIRTTLSPSALAAATGPVGLARFGDAQIIYDAHDAKVSPFQRTRREHRRNKVNPKNPTTSSAGRSIAIPATAHASTSDNITADSHLVHPIYHGFH